MLVYSIRFPNELRIRERGSSNTWYTDSLFDDDDHYYVTRYPGQDGGGLPSYLGEGFLAIQDAIANAYANMTDSTKLTWPDIQIQRFPIPSMIYHKFANQLYISLLLVLSLSYTFVNMIRFIAIEKEKQLKETMKVMGLANWMHYLSWCIRSIAMLLIPMILVTICLKVSTFESISSKNLLIHHEWPPTTLFPF